jgi:hypothetical protein
LVGNPEEKKPFRRYRRRRLRSVKIELIEFVLEHVDWISVAQSGILCRGFVYTVMNTCVP